VPQCVFSASSRQNTGSVKLAEIRHRKGFQQNIGVLFDVIGEKEVFMKNIKFLLGLLTIVLVMASCAATQGAMGDDYATDGRTQQVGNRLYVEDPYYGTVVLERDPVTGRYYDVTYGSRFGTGYYGAYPYGGGFRNYRRGGGYYGGGTVIQQSPSRGEIQQHRDETRKKILGN
jgi:hypothetical protein